MTAGVRAGCYESHKYAHLLKVVISVSGSYLMSENLHSSSSGTLGLGTFQNLLWYASTATSQGQSMVNSNRFLTTMTTLVHQTMDAHGAYSHTHSRHTATHVCVRALLYRKSARRSPPTQNKGGLVDTRTGGSLAAPSAHDASVMCHAIFAHFKPRCRPCTTNHRTQQPARAEMAMPRGPSKAKVGVSCTMCHFCLAG